MFERITEQHQAITTALCLSGRNALCVSSSDVSLLKAVMAVLKPFEATTKEISSDKHVSISKVIHLAKSLQRLNGAITGKDTPLVSNLSYPKQYPKRSHAGDVDAGSSDEEIGISDSAA